MSDGLEKINSADVADAESMFRDCCGSSEWAKKMTSSRPFNSEAEMLAKAVKFWNDLDANDWLEAFAAHPRIGETRRAPTQQARSASWSADEQAGASSANEKLKEELADLNRKYFEKFGFIYIVCATGKSAAEMTEICRDRLGNDRETEIANAAAEQQKITEIRLRKLLSQ
jgi:OHCU decarboxylase